MMALLHSSNESRAWLIDEKAESFCVTGILGNHVTWIDTNICLRVILIAEKQPSFPNINAKGALYASRFHSLKIVADGEMYRAFDCRGDCIKSCRQ